MSQEKWLLWLLLGHTNRIFVSGKRVTLVLQTLVNKLRLKMSIEIL